ncbi:DUF1998 domain-containing protein [Bifidobacterium indicum]|uniref:DUF1998 domain-containing protein n=1 Tax=Bifidobacterium indicum TaxID=1691 RepID=UPI0030DA565B
MTKGKIRRSQLITPFGVGAMSTLVDGTSVITAGLDYWYTDGSHQTKPNTTEFEIHDWRLEQRLGVGSFRLPPDYRDSDISKADSTYRIHVPVLRFPRWHFCMYCKRLELVPLTAIEPATCDCRQSKTRMSQVPFVAICAEGHITDFPFNEWVHRTDNPNCSGPLRLKSHGGGSLEGQVVECDTCKRTRTLRGITSAHLSSVTNEESTDLSSRLNEDGRPFLCRGAEPWLQLKETRCGQQLQGALRSAGNIYFPKVESSIFIPYQNDPADEDLLNIVGSTNFHSAISLIQFLLADNTINEQQIPSILRNSNKDVLSNFDDNQILAAVKNIAGPLTQEPISSNPVLETTNQVPQEKVLSDRNTWRFPEYEYLRETPSHSYLRCQNPETPKPLLAYLDRVRQVTTLQETRALRGFTRLRDTHLGLDKGKRLMRRKPINSQLEDWLPACVVKGEGIYLELNKDRLSNWEKRPDVVHRSSLINTRYAEAVKSSGLEPREFTPRFVLLHTLSHILINQLVFTCGYSSAALRERLYASTKVGEEMGGLLIYTAAGDSDGTLGGLVRMATTDRLLEVFARAIDNARWCSTDPVCMDSGEQGQGPNSCNLAACHGCALLPETSCEEFNRFLDRGLLIGTFTHTDMGYFSDLVLS